MWQWLVVSLALASTSTETLNTAQTPWDTSSRTAQMDAPFGRTVGLPSHVSSIGMSVRQVHQKVRPITPRSPVVFAKRDAFMVIWGTEQQVREDLQKLKQLTAVVGFSHADNSVFQDLEDDGPRGIEDVVYSDPPDTVKVGLCVERHDLKLGKEDWVEIFDGNTEILKQIRKNVDWIGTAMLDPRAVMASHFVIDLIPDSKEKLERDAEEMKRIIRTIDESAIGRAVIDKMDLSDLVASISGEVPEKVYVFMIRPGFRGKCVYETQRFEGIEGRWKSQSGVYGLPMRMADLASKFTF